MISSAFTYNGCKTVLHMWNTRVKLDEPSMYRHGLRTLETERSNVNHIVDIVGERSNFKKIPTHTQDHGDGIATRGESVCLRTLVDR